MNEQLIRETTRAGVRGLIYVFAVVICCISSHASFFQTRRPLTVSARKPTIGSER